MFYNLVFDFRFFILVDELVRGFEIRIIDMLKTYFGVEILNYWRAPYLFLQCPNYDLLFGFPYDSGMHVL